MNVELVACNAIKIHLKTGRVAAFIVQIDSQYTLYILT